MAPSVGIRWRLPSESGGAFARNRVAPSLGIRSPGLRYSATLGWITAPSPVYPEGVASTTDTGRNPFRVKRGGAGVFSQGSGVPQPWASRLNPVGILGDTGRVGNGWGKTRRAGSAKRNPPKKRVMHLLLFSNHEPHEPHETGTKESKRGEDSNSVFPLPLENSIAPQTADSFRLFSYVSCVSWLGKGVDFASLYPPYGKTGQRIAARQFISVSWHGKDVRFMKNQSPEHAARGTRLSRRDYIN